jgi:arylsulfatase A-like enzyme
MKPFFLILTALSLLGVSLSAEQPKKPNIVFLFADQWRGSATGYEGDPNVKAPNLDRLAKESLNFRNAVSVLPVCTPYRAALMSGRYPTSTGIFMNDLHLPDKEFCIAEALKEAGYTTGYIGKWHIDGNGRSAYIPPERRQGWEYWKAFECSHNYMNSPYYSGDSNVKKHWEGFDSFAQTKDAQQYIRDNASGSKPFALMLSYGPPHSPHQAPKKYVEMYPIDKIKLPPNVPAKDQPKVKKFAQGYYAQCTIVDECVGEILKTLEETGLADNTIVVFTSDHGETLGSHGVKENWKQVAWSESAHVPFLLRYPAVQKGKARVVTTPLTTPDIYPTLLGLAGIGIPKTVEGMDLAPLLREGRDEDRAVLYMGVAPFSMPGFEQEYRAIRTNQYTYVRRLDGPWLLYDDVKDPNQIDNLVAKPGFAELLVKLDADLSAQLKSIGDEFKPAQFYLEKWGHKKKKRGQKSKKDAGEESASEGE